MKRSIRRRFGRRGSAVVETAVMAPVTLAMLFGMMEAGYSFMIRQTVTNAAREGARTASLSGNTMTEVQSAVGDTMGAANLTGYTVTSNLSSLSPTDTDVWVQVSIPFSRASFSGGFFGGGSFNITSKVSMNREGVADSSGSQGQLP